MKRLRFKYQKHLIAAWFKRLEIRRRPKPPVPISAKERLEYDMVKARGI